MGDWAVLILTGAVIGVIAWISAIRSDVRQLQRRVFGTDDPARLPPLKKGKDYD